MKERVMREKGEMCRSDANIASEASLLIEEEQITVIEGVVDYKGNRAKRSSSCGGWRSASFIMGAGTAERFAFYGVSSNLITYLTGPLGQSAAAASENVNAWAGVVSMLPLVGALVADSCLGRYRSIFFASLLYVLGLGLLTISVTLISSSRRGCANMESNNISCSSSSFQIILFFSSLYLLAIAQGGHKPCIEAFGADQFDARDRDESKSKSSFFNWWACVLALGTSISYLALFYIQENLSWGLGFGIPCIFMALSLLIFLLGTKSYRYCVEEENERSPFSKIFGVFVSAVKNWRSSLTAQEEVETSSILSHQFKFLDKALSIPSGHQEGSVCRMSDVNDAKRILQLVPIWLTSLPFTIIYAQSTTFFTKQGSTMDRNIGSNFQIPAASLQIFISLSVILFIPLYDRIFVPVARAFSGIPSGITTLQRIGFGMLTYIVSMVVAALIEKKRLKTALDYGLVDDQGATVPMSIWWLAPQYLLFGLSNIFMPIGLQELFYDQVPNGLRSLGISLFFSIFGVGNFLSSFLILVLEKVTSADGQDSWFSNNLNRAHLDYFYWVLVGLGMIGLVTYMYFSKSYIYNRWNTM